MILCAFADEASPYIGGQIRAMERNGIFRLEIRGVDRENIKDITPRKAEEVRARLDDAGIRVWSMGSPIGKQSLSEDFGPHLDDFRRFHHCSHRRKYLNLHRHHHFHRYRHFHLLQQDRLRE